MTALFGDADHAWLDGLRRAHYPPERNLVPAHLTLFHHLPPGIAPELKARLSAETRGVPPPRTRIAAIQNLGQGTALRVESAALEEIRARLADAFHGLLVPQDMAAWRPHVTIQNKVDPNEARQLQQALSDGFKPRPLALAGLAAWRYRRGPWEAVSRHPFGG